PLVDLGDADADAVLREEIVSGGVDGALVDVLPEVVVAADRAGRECDLVGRELDQVFLGGERVGVDKLWAAGEERDGAGGRIRRGGRGVGGGGVFGAAEREG